MSNKRNRNTSKTLTQDQCALLMLVKTKPFVGKPLLQPVANRYKTEADADASVAWSHLKSECVLLKKAR
jgi:hypothetical protein